MKWWLFVKQEDPDKLEIPTLPVIILTVMIIAICLAIRAVTWPGNKHVDLSFFMPSVVFPLFVIVTVVRFACFITSGARHYEETRVAIEKEHEYNLKMYARDYLVIAGWNSLTPLEEPALNMLKLEGEFPLAPKTPLTIPRSEAFEATQNELLFRRLLLPLRDKLKNHYRQFESVMWVRGGDESCRDELQRTFESLGITPGDITYLSNCPDYSQMNKWMDCGSWSSVNKLVIIIDMHDENADEKGMENACALLLTNHYVAAEGEKAVYLYRPITGITDVEKKIPIYLHVEPLESPKTLWYTGLSKVEKYPLMQMLDERKLAPNRLDMEKSLGAFMGGYRWLALALAADAIKYAQGDQFVAASEGNKLGMAALSSRWSGNAPLRSGVYYHPPFIEGAMFGIFLSFSIIVGMISFGSPDKLEKLSGWFYLYLMLFPAFLFLAVGVWATLYLGGKAQAHMWGYDE